MAMTKDSAPPESPRASNGCCGCLGGQWLGKRPVTLQIGDAAAAEATQQQRWETASPALGLLVPPSSPASLESSVVQSSATTTPTHRSTSPLDDEELQLDLGFFTRQHRASFVDDDIDESDSHPLNDVAPPPWPSPSVDDGFSSFAGGSQADAAQTEDFAPFQSRDSFSQFQGNTNPSRVPPPVQVFSSLPSYMYAGDVSEPEPEPEMSGPPEAPDEKPSPSHRPPFAVPRLASPAQFLREKIKQEEAEEAQVRAQEVEAAAQAEPPRVIVPLLATPDQFRMQKLSRQKEAAEESLRAKQEEDAKLAAEAARHHVPILASPEVVHSQRARQRALEEAAEMEAVQQATIKQKVVIPKLQPPGSSANLDPSERGDERHDGGARIDGEQDEAPGQSPRYVELASRVDHEQLSLDIHLETAKSRGLNSKLLLLLEWSQLRANSLEESVARLSAELTHQQAAYLDLQKKYLAHVGINLPPPSTNSDDHSQAVDDDE